MPILPEKMIRYPGGSICSPEWQAIVKQIRRRSGNQCEGDRLGVHPDCRAVNGQPHPITGARVVLTVAHLTHDESETDFELLAHGCQRCHNAYDAPHRAKTRSQRKRLAWKAVKVPREQDGPAYCFEVEDGQDVVADVYDLDGDDGESAARLIAAAPDMLDELKSIL